MTDHNGPVNVVRFNSSGRFLASGSDDGIACVFELRPGAGGGVLGGEANIENWRVKHILRGHSSHVVDLGWSPDDTRIATASLDSTVGIWDAATGSRIATLKAHSSFVKGVAWDPVGTYLATISEDKSVAVFRTDDWSLVATVTEPFDRMVTATFACRLSWSPDGRFLLAGNSFQGATHAAVAVPREAWDKPEEYLLVSGHAGAIVATAFAPKLFRVPPLGGGAPGEDLSAIFAVGGQDKRITVWSSSANRPIFCGARLFKSQVLDLAWTADGMTLLASSSEGTVACLQFEKSELGEPASSEDMAEIMKTLYGSSTGRAMKRVFAESAEQLEMEERSAAGMAAANGRPALAPVPQQEAAQQAKQAAAPTDALAALDARLGGPSAAGAVTQTGFGGSTDTAAAAGPAGVTPAALLAAHQQQQLMPPPPSRPPGSLGGQASAPKRPRLEMASAFAAPGGSTALATVAAPGAAAPAGVGGAFIGQAILSPLPRIPSLRVPLGSTSLLITEATADGGTFSAVPLELQILNKESRPGSGPYAELCLVKGGTPLWHDLIPSTVVAAVGTAFFSAVATADGHLILHTPAGRRAAPPLRIGAGIALLAAGGDSRVLVVTTMGRVKLVDALSLEELMEAELTPLLEGGATVLDVRLTKEKGKDGHKAVPVVTLTDSSAYIWHTGLRSWLRVADDSLASSRFSSVPRVPGQGELAEVQAEALAGSSRQRHLPRIAGASGSTAAALAQQHLARGVAETNLAAAQALGSATEYKAWLGTYARSLSDAGDESRLRELADSLLGPPPGSNANSDIADGPGSWVPTVLGLAKRDLLREVVLREMARNRGLGGLLQRCRQALDDIQAAEGIAGAAR